MILKILEWDSAFFGIKTASMQADLKNVDIEKLKQEIRDEQIKLIYVFESRDQSHDDGELPDFFTRMQLVDRKVTYSKSVKEEDSAARPGVGENDGHLDNDLLELAYAAGKYSRFFVDKKMPAGKAKELYKLWIQRSVSGEIADKVFESKENGVVKGFISVKCKEDGVSIGLVAVEENTRGQGIGKTLIEKCEEFTRNSKKNKLSVVTQLDNVLACKFYESCGFAIEKVENIYHIWL